MGPSSSNSLHRRHSPFHPSHAVASGSSNASNSVNGLNGPQGALHRRSTPPVLDERDRQQRNTSLPPRVIPAARSFGRRPPHTDSNEPVFSSAPSPPGYRPGNHSPKPVERAIDPRKRPIHQSNSALPATAIPTAKGPSSDLEPDAVPATSNSLADTVTAMANGADPSPTGVISSLFVALSEASFAAGVANVQNSQAKTEVDQAVEEYNKNIEMARNKPPIIHFLETRKKAAEKDYSQSSDKLSSASKLRDSIARDLATAVLTSFQEYAADASKSLAPDPSLIERLDRFESNEAQSYKVDKSLMSSLESRVSAFETSTVSNRAQVMQKINDVRDEDRKQIDSLRNHIKDISGQLDAIVTKVHRMEERDQSSPQELDVHGLPSSEVLSDLKTQITSLEMEMIELKSQVTSMHVDAQKPSDPLATSTMFLDYVKIYQRDRAEDLAKFKAMDESLSAISKRFEEHKNETSSSIHALDTKLLAGVPQHAVMNSAGIDQELKQLQTHVDSFIQQQQRSIGEISNRVQKLESFTHSLNQNMSQLIHAIDHSVKALTSRYNNLSSEQLAKRMANHINQFPNTLQLEQNELKARMNHLEAQHQEQKAALDLMKASIAEDALRSSSEDLSMQNFENRMKTNYYDVLEDKVREYRDDIRESIEKLQSAQGLIKTAQETLLQRVNELEGEVLLRSFQRTSGQKPTAQSEPYQRGLPQADPSTPKDDSATENSNALNSFKQVGDSIVVKPTPPCSHRKRPKQ